MEKLSKIAALQIAEEAERNGHPFSKEEDLQYKKLWKLLIDKDMKKSQLREAASLSSSTIAKLTRNEYVALDVLVRICVVLSCDIGDIVEIKLDEQ